MTDGQAARVHCDRYWLLTTTMYGTWLPGDRRGFVSDVRADNGSPVRHNVPGTPHDSDMPWLEEHARQKIVGAPVRLDHEHADVLLDQFHETAMHRTWQLFAVAIMSNHTHIVIGVPGDPEPELLLKDLKSYGSRKLNKLFGRRKSGTWWTESGSRRKLPDNEAVLSAIRYVLNQEFPLVIWTTAIPELGLPGGRIV